MSASNTVALASDLSGQMAATAPKRSNVMELTISGIGSNNPTSEINWVTPDGAVGKEADAAVTPNQGTARNSTVTKTTANTVPLTGFLDVAGVATSTLDAGGLRYIATRIKVRNAPSCATPGTCAPYLTARKNVTFFAVSTTTTINQTAVSRFKRFDGSDANFALTTSMLPAHGVSAETLRVFPGLASLQVYNESELPPAEATVTSVFPYGFVVKNVNNSSRNLPANPANNQYDGEVTFGFTIPVQALPTDDPFKISLRFQTADDLNVRVTQSTQEQDFLGDIASGVRASNLSGNDLVVLGGRVARTPIGNPICRVRTAGSALSPTAFLVNQIPATPLIQAAPSNLSFVDRASDVSVGFCENMAAPSTGTLVINGSQSGRRVVAGAYGGVLTGGGVTAQRNQLVWNLNGARPYFAGEEVSFTATSGNTSASAVPIAPFVGSFRIKGTQAISAGTFGVASNIFLGASPLALALGDVDGDGNLDIVTANQSNTLSVLLGNGIGGVAAPINLPVSGFPQWVTLGDLNGDGLLDIVTANFSTNNFSLLLGTGGGGFTAVSNFPVGTSPVSVALGDVNGDGKLDIATANYGSNTVSVWQGNGAGGVTSVANFAVGTKPDSVVLVDVDSDGKLDMVVSNEMSNNVSVLLGNGAGGFAAATNFAVGTKPYMVVVGDVNGDGRPDIVTPNSIASSVSVLLGDGVGGFAAAVSYAVPLTPRAVSLGDVNGDSKLDIVVASYGANNTSVLLGNGSGGFATALSYTTGLATSVAALGDLNGDGKLDIVTANFSSNNSSILLGQ